MIYDTWTMDELCQSWRVTLEHMDAVSHALVDEISRLQAELAAKQAPYLDAAAELEAEIYRLTLDAATSYKADGVQVNYRKGTRRVTYEWRTVDTVLGTLRDILPETAATLEDARKETIGKPSVSVKRT